MVSMMPIVFHEEIANDVVLLDDDPLICQVWSMKAKQGSKKLKIFNTCDQFLIFLDQLDALQNANVEFFIDHELGGSMKGIEVAKIIYGRGFRKIFLTTGHEADHFDPKEISFLKGVIGKTPPWHRLSGEVAQMKDK